MKKIFLYIYENVKAVKKQEGPYQNLYAYLLGLKKMVPFLADPTVGNCWEKCQMRSSISTLWGLQQPLFKKKEVRVRQHRLWNFKLGDIILVTHKPNVQWQVIQWQAWKNFISIHRNLNHRCNCDLWLYYDFFGKF